mmetsp:Transcript_89237/g.195603  ORF Transcript_89237/g.195603 Transcript_89237/m.195603 type:complete len:1050 (+) Transcript_89237:222-3371(+)
MRLAGVPGLKDKQQNHQRVVFGKGNGHQTDEQSSSESQSDSDNPRRKAMPAISFSNPLGGGHDYKVTSEDVRLAKSHGEFSLGWREHGRGGQDTNCPCGCGMKGGTRARLLDTSSQQLLDDGAAFALYFALMKKIGVLCLVVGILMIPIWVLRINSKAEGVALGLSGAFGSAGILGVCAKENEDATDGKVKCHLLEAAGLLNAAILAAVFVFLPDAHRSLQRTAAHVTSINARSGFRDSQETVLLEQQDDGGLLDENANNTNSNNSNNYNNNSSSLRATRDLQLGSPPEDVDVIDVGVVDGAGGAVSSSRAPPQTILLSNLPSDATEASIIRFLLSELHQATGLREAEVAGHVVGDALAPDGEEATAAFAETGSRIKVLLVPADQRLAPLLTRYLQCLRLLREVEQRVERRGGAEMGGGGVAAESPTELLETDPALQRARAELREAENALRQPRRTFGDRGWDCRAAPVGVAVLGDPMEAMILGEALAPPHLAKRIQRCCCAKSLPDRGLYRQMQGVRAIYPAPEPSDVIWDNLCYGDSRSACKRRTCSIMLALLYLGLVFGLLITIKQTLHNGLAVAILTALSTLLLQEAVRQLTWRFERPYARTHYHASVAVLTMGGCCITGLCVPVFTLYTASGEGLDTKSLWYGKEGIGNWAIHQFITNATIAVILDALVDTMLPWIFSNILRRPSPERPSGNCIQRCLPSPSSFRELCDIFEGPEFYLGPNIGYISFTLVLPLAFAPIFPGAPFLAAFMLAFWYAKEKWLLLEVCRRPRLISPHVAVRGPDILSYGLAFAPLVGAIGLLPLAPESFCTHHWLIIGECDRWFNEGLSLIWMGVEACIFANAAVHGPLLAQELAQHFACCGRCCGRGRRRGQGCRNCCRGTARVGTRTFRAVFGTLTAVFCYLMSYWRGGIGKWETIPLGFGNISIFGNGVRETLNVVYDIVVISLIVLGTTGLLCRLFKGPSETAAKLSDYEETMSSVPSKSVSLEEAYEVYTASSPFHAVLGQSRQSEGTAEARPSASGTASEACSGLRAWLEAPAYNAPAVPT